MANTKHRAGSTDHRPQRQPSLQQKCRLSRPAPEHAQKERALPYSNAAAELMLRAHLALHNFVCCCCGYTSCLLNTTCTSPLNSSSQCPACTHVACGDCIVVHNADHYPRLTLIPPAADYHQAPSADYDDGHHHSILDHGSPSFSSGYICRGCGFLVVVGAERRAGLMHHQAGMVVFVGKACRRCGQVYELGKRLKFKVTKVHPFVTGKGGRAGPSAVGSRLAAVEKAETCVLQEHRRTGDNGEEPIPDPSWYSS